MSNAPKVTMKEKVLQYVESIGTARFTDIQKFIVETNYGKGSYIQGRKLERVWNYKTQKYSEAIRNSYRGYYCCAFSGRRPYFLIGVDKLVKNENGKYSVVRGA
jgi:hypothetical protein